MYTDIDINVIPIWMEIGFWYYVGNSEQKCIQVTHCYDNDNRPDEGPYVSTN